MGWDKGMQNILKFTNKDDKTISLIVKYAETLCTSCGTFIQMGSINSNKQAAQNNKWMWHCLYNSLTKEAKATLLTYQKDYEMEVNRETKVVTSLMYKTIMSLTTLDGNATVTALQANRHELRQYEIKENGSINSIDNYFNQNYAQLKVQGQLVDNAHTILFNAYPQGVPHATFHDYTRRLQDNWMDQTGDMKDSMH